MRYFINDKTRLVYYRSIIIIILKIVLLLNMQMAVNKCTYLHIIIGEFAPVDGEW